jgi:hypothetical protein
MRKKIRTTGTKAAPRRTIIFVVKSPAPRVRDYPGKVVT